MTNSEYMHGFRSGCRKVSYQEQFFFQNYPHPDDHELIHLLLTKLDEPDFGFVLILYSLDINKY